MPPDREESVADVLLWGEPEEALELCLRLAGERSVESFFEDVLGPALVEVGERWARNEVSVAEEHRATQTARDVLGVLKHVREPARTPGARVAVVASVQGEPHDIGARMVADVLDSRGWRVHYLGANVPTRDLADFLEGRSVDAVFLSVSTALHLRELEEAVAAARRAPGEPLVVVGGRPFALDSSLADRFDADAAAAGPQVARTLDEVEAALASR